MSSFYKGEEQLLYLIVSTIDRPIICLVNNSFSETVDMIETTTTDNGGWKTSRPQNQSYTIDFEGLQVITEQATPTSYSLDTLRILKRARTRIEWKLKVEGVFEETGEGYITNLTENAPVGEILSFNGTIEGYGAPVTVDISDNVYTYEDNAVYIFND